MVCCAYADPFTLLYQHVSAAWTKARTQYCLQSRPPATGSYRQPSPNSHHTSHSIWHS